MSAVSLPTFPVSAAGLDRVGLNKNLGGQLYPEHCERTLNRPAIRRNGGVDAPYRRSSSCNPLARHLGSHPQSDLRVANNLGQPARATFSIYSDNCSPVAVGRLCLVRDAAFGNFHARAHRCLEGARLRWPRSLFIGVAAWILNLAVGAGLSTVLHPSLEALRGLQAMLPHALTEKALWAGFALTAGVCEEVVYRGYLLRQFRALTGSTFAALILQAVC